MPVEEAEFVKNVTLDGLGRRPWGELRQRFIPRSVLLPPYNVMLEFEKTVCYKLIEYEGGWRATLSEIFQVRT